jgi:hypothetical protein
VFDFTGADAAGSNFPSINSERCSVKTSENFSKVKWANAIIYVDLARILELAHRYN